MCGALDVDAGLGAATGVEGLMMGLGTGAPVEAARAGIWTMGLRPMTMVFGTAPLELFSRLRATGCSGLTSTLTGALSTSPAGEHILHVQLAMSLFSSVHSHSRWGKNSTGLRKRFVGPLG